MRAFVIAMESEADAVRPHLRGDDRLFVAGIGKVNAAAATQRAIDAGVDEVVNAGLCGGFGSDVVVGGLYEVRAAVEYDFDLAQVNGTRIGQLDERDSPFLTLDVVGRHPAKILATGDRFNDAEDDYRLIIEELGAELRDMEGAAVAHVCERARVSCRSLKCVTNVAGSGSMTGQYEKNAARCLAILRKALGEWL